MNNHNHKKKPEKAKTISIILSSEDQVYIDKIAKQYGLNKTTDCLRLALRVAVNRNSTQSQTV